MWPRRRDLWAGTFRKGNFVPRNRASKTKSGVVEAAAPAATASPGVIEATNTDSRNSSDPDEEIAALAYSYWEARGGAGGSASEDWFRAKQELSARQRR